MSKEDVLLELAQTQDFVSGASIAEKLGITRAAVWKLVDSLRAQGYNIEAVRNRGYRLADAYDVLAHSAVAAQLPSDLAPLVHVVGSVGSTNDEARALAESGAREYTTVIADHQTQGRGRRGRSFVSPAGTGVYLSMVLRPSLALVHAQEITCAAALAASRAIDKTFCVNTGIKWINDVYLGSGKVCGILTEAQADIETGGLSYAIVGMGVNVYAAHKAEGPVLPTGAGYVCDKPQQGLRSALAGRIIANMVEQQASWNREELTAAYKDKSIMEGKRIMVHALDGTHVQACALGVDDNLGLRVRYGDGSEAVLNSGEVSITFE